MAWVRNTPPWWFEGLQSGSAPGLFSAREWRSKRSRGPRDGWDVKVPRDFSDGVGASVLGSRVVDEFVEAGVNLSGVAVLDETGQPVATIL